MTANRNGGAPFGATADDGAAVQSVHAPQTEDSTLSLLRAVDDSAVAEPLEEPGVFVVGRKPAHQTTFHWFSRRAS